MSIAVRRSIHLGQLSLSPHTSVSMSSRSRVDSHPGTNALREHGSSLTPRHCGMLGLSPDSTENHRMFHLSYVGGASASSATSGGRFVAVKRLSPHHPCKPAARCQCSLIFADCATPEHVKRETHVKRSLSTGRLGSFGRFLTRQLLQSGDSGRQCAIIITPAEDSA